MRRLCKFRLHCPTWRFTFHKIIYNTNIRQNVFICKNANIRKTDYLLQINANRLGNKIADIVWISLKTSPEKDRLLLPSVSRRLASKRKNRCCSMKRGFSPFLINMKNFLHITKPKKLQLIPRNPFQNRLM